MRTLIPTPKALAVIVMVLLSFPLIIPASNHPAAAISIWVDFGRGGKFDCDPGFAICRISPSSKGGATNGVLRTQGQTATIEFSKMPTVKGDMLMVDKDVPLPAAVSRQLGSKGGCTVLQGEYPVSYARNKNGTVDGVKLKCANP